MDKTVIALLALIVLFLASCASPPASPPTFIHVVPAYQELAVSYDEPVRTPQIASLKPPTSNFKPLSDAGLPCTETYQCEGFCLAVEPDTALGYCSDTRTPRGCWEYLLGKNVTKRICS